MKKFTAFTLIEILLAMAVIGVISAVAANGLKNVNVNESRLRFKKIYEHFSKTITDMQADENVYPHVALFDGETEVLNSRTGEAVMLGFSNPYIMQNSVNNLVKNKFAKQLKERTAGSVQTTNDETNGKYVFTAKDRSYWYIDNFHLTDNLANKATTRNVEDGKEPKKNLSVPYGLGYAVVKIDVNGTDKNPNCPNITAWTAESNSSDLTVTATPCSDKIIPDTFLFKVYTDGTIEIPDNFQTVTGHNQRQYLLNNHFLDTNEDTTN